MKMNVDFLVVESDTRAYQFANTANTAPTTVNDVDEWAKQIQTSQGAIGLLEFGFSRKQSELKTRLEIIQRISRNSVYPTTLLALADGDLSQFRKELLISGISRVFCSQSEADLLQDVIRNHHAFYPRCLTFEQELKLRLPW